MFFLLFLHDDRRIWIWIRIHTSDQWIRILEAQKHVDPVDPDPEHWLLAIRIRESEVRILILISSSKKIRKILIPTVL
jgi:hypothetical protein